MQDIMIRSLHHTLQAIAFVPESYLVSSSHLCTSQLVCAICQHNRLLSSYCNLIDADPAMIVLLLR